MTRPLEAAGDAESPSSGSAWTGSSVSLAEADASLPIHGVLARTRAPRRRLVDRPYRRDGASSENSYRCVGLLPTIPRFANAIMTLPVRVVRPSGPGSRNLSPVGFGAPAGQLKEEDELSRSAGPGGSGFFMADGMGMRAYVATTSCLRGAIRRHYARFARPAASAEKQVMVSRIRPGRCGPDGSGCHLNRGPGIRCPAIPAWRATGAGDRRTAVR